VTKAWLKAHFLYRFGVVLCAFSLLACGDKHGASVGQSLESQISGQWSQLPVVLTVDDEIANDSAMMDDVRAAAAFWEVAAQKSLFNLQLGWNGPVPPFSGTYEEPTSVQTNLLFFVDPWPYAASIKGHTVVNEENHIFTSGVVYLQHQDYCIGECDADFSRISFRRLVAHELGHFLGLKHSPDPNDVMYADIAAGASLSAATYNSALLKALVH
jgi:hypothetical protein